MKEKEKAPISEGKGKNDVTQDKNNFLNSNELGDNIIFRVGDSFLKKISRFDIRGNEVEDYICLKKETITDLFGKDVIRKIPYYDSETIVPQNENYKRVLGSSINRYFPPDTLPAYEDGAFPTWSKLIEHIFSVQSALGWKYLALLYKKPLQILPVLVLVSEENSTGKSTFGNALSYLFGRNVGFYSQMDLSSSFNVWQKSLVAIFEEINETKSTIDKLKAISTARLTTINEKFRPQVSFTPFCKVIINSNNVDSVLHLTENDIRFWVLKVPKFKEFDALFDDKLKDEAPFVLRYLSEFSNKDLGNPKSRMFFALDEIRTTALEDIIEESKSPLEKDIRIWYNEQKSVNNEMDFGFLICEIYEAFGKKYAQNEISKCLRKEMKLSNQLRQYTDRYGNTRIGRAYSLNTLNTPLTHF